MVFNSLSFLFFFIAVFALYWSVPKKFQWCVLLASGYLFYGICSAEYLLLILLITAVSYLSALYLEKNRNNAKASRRCLAFTCLFILAFLFFFKYFNFLSESVCRILQVFSVEADPFLIRVLLPVGLSFYTFTVIGYVVDVFKGKTPAEHHFGKYAAFISFFPTLLSGPIERADNLLAQIRQEHSFHYGQAVLGSREILFGLFKKMVIADTLAIYVNMVFGSVRSYSGFTLMLAILFYTIQIYCDFSGYSDIAIGVSRLLGIQLRPNFRQPYFAASIKAFWGRWHISLSTWFRDYVYIPLGGNRVSPLRHKLNLMTTFLVSGLWHGASWNFILWGGIHGGVQVVESLLPKAKTKTASFFRWILTMLVVSFAWVFFRANTLSDAFYVLSHLLTGIGDPTGYIVQGYRILGLSNVDLLVICGNCLILFLLDFCCFRWNGMEQISNLPVFLRWGIYLLLLLLIIFFTPLISNSQFLYFQF